MKGTKPIVSVYFLGSLFFLLIACISAYWKGNHALSFAINQYHFPFLDFFFLTLTWFASVGVICTPLLLLIYHTAIHKSNLNYLIAAILCFLGLWLTMWLCKTHIFGPLPRPVHYFPQLHRAWNIELNTRFSFPSGHSAAAFLGCGILSIFEKGKFWQLFCLFAAVLMAYSRIYLGQHFLLDTCAGAAIGLFYWVLFQKQISKIPIQ